MTRWRIGVFAVLFLATTTCAPLGPVYPARPMQAPGPAIADPSPSRVVTHVGITGEGMTAALEAKVPAVGEGTFPLLGGNKSYRWERGPLTVTFASGKIVLETPVQAQLPTPLGSLTFALSLRVQAEPVVSQNYVIKLQSLDVVATSRDSRLKFADIVAGALELIQNGVKTKLAEFAYDLKPLLQEAQNRLTTPMMLPLSEGVAACATFSMMGIEAGPTQLADGFEKDFALIIAPSVQLPCPEQPTDAGTTPLPLLSNVALVQSGPFTVTLPIAARYDELTKVLQQSMFTAGKYFFSKDEPELYLADPAVFESMGQLVVKLHLGGRVKKAGLELGIDGDIYLAGHATVVDNELAVPDLEPTVETSNLLLSLKASADREHLRDQARSALRLDLSARFSAVKERLSKQLSFGDQAACFRGTLDKIEVKEVHAHGQYVRIIVAATARSEVRVPCPFMMSARPDGGVPGESQK